MKKRRRVFDKLLRFLKPPSSAGRHWITLGLLSASTAMLQADDAEDPSNPLLWDIKRLMDTKISIIGPTETVANTPAAVAVVTQEDIRRSGAASIPEALRLVPGLEVAQLDASQWAVTARGFNDV